jgi:diketogulonate reductase-like aldo/keto reductase
MPAPSAEADWSASLGKSDLFITPIGFGAWAIGGGGWEFAWGAQDDRDSVAAIHEVLDAGIIRLHQVRHGLERAPGDRPQSQGRLDPDNPAVTGAIVGARRPDQVRGVAGVAGLRLNPREVAEIDALFTKVAVRPATAPGADRRAEE